VRLRSTSRIKTNPLILLFLLTILPRFKLVYTYYGQILALFCFLNLDLLSPSLIFPLNSTNQYLRKTGILIISRSRRQKNPFRRGMGALILFRGFYFISSVRVKTYLRLPSYTSFLLSVQLGLVFRYRFYPHSKAHH
jgi:hypothetical protein